MPINEYRQFMKSYINNKGKIVIIKDMPDAYLLNSYAYHKKRAEAVKSESFMSEYDIELQRRIEALRTEIMRRKLL